MKSPVWEEASGLGCATMRVWQGCSELGAQGAASWGHRVQRAGATGLLPVWLEPKHCSCARCHNSNEKQPFFLCCYAAQRWHVAQCLFREMVTLNVFSEEWKNTKRLYFTLYVVFFCFCFNVYSFTYCLFFFYVVLLSVVWEAEEKVLVVLQEPGHRTWQGALWTW